MNRKNVIRTLTIIAVVLLLGWSFFYFSDNTRGYKPVDTSVAMAQINSDNVKSAQIDDREQQVRLDLKNGNGDTQDSDKIITKYPTGYGVDLFNALQAKEEARRRAEEDARKAEVERRNQEAARLAAERRQFVAGDADNQQRIRLACAEVAQRGVLFGASLGRAEIDAEVDKLRIRVPTASANRRL